MTELMIEDAIDDRPLAADLADDDRRLLADLRDRAAAVRSRAYVPYTDFDAGAAVGSRAGTHHVGALVENVSLGLAMCAERAAIFATVAAGERPQYLVLDAPSTRDDVTFPCGACLQVALEVGGPDMIIGAANDHTLQVARVRDLLPRAPYIDLEK